MCVQNFYNVAHRDDDDLIDSLAAQGIAYVPYFPLGGFTPLQSDTLNAVATRLGATPMAVALAWLLQRSPNILLIPGTSSVAHLRENVAGAALTLSEDDLAELNEHCRTSTGVLVRVVRLQAPDSHTWPSFRRRNARRAGRRAVPSCAAR